MNQTEFEKLQQSVRQVFSGLYLIDVEELTAAQRVQHQAALSAAYLALVNAENSQFGKLTEPARQQLADLALRIHAVKEGLEKLELPGEKLNYLAQDVDGLSRLARLIDAGV